MFRITRDPSSGSLIERLAKITVMVLSCTVTGQYLSGSTSSTQGIFRAVSQGILIVYCLNELSMLNRG